MKAKKRAALRDAVNNEGRFMESVTFFELSNQSQHLKPLVFMYKEIFS